MALKQTKEYWQMREARLTRILQKAAKQMSEDGKAKLGSLAWGRHGAEYGPGAGLQDFIHAASWLQGYQDCLLGVLNQADRDILFKTQGLKQRICR